MIALEPHPLLDAAALAATFASPLSQVDGSALAPLLRPEAQAPLESSDEVRAAVRNLLRHGGFKPTGRSKPASEYLLRAAAAGELKPINAAADAGNAVSLHSGLPISVVDLDRTTSPLRIATAKEGASFVFNSSGQAIDLGGLVCLFDANGPCANAVKDAQRSKTDGTTTHALCIVWGTLALPGRTEQTATWYRSLLQALGANVSVCQVSQRAP